MGVNTVRYLWLFLPLSVYATESFMTDYEYGEMLYHNPRGISCAACHGSSGEGKVIVQYTEGKKQESIKGSDIRNKSLTQMTKSLHNYHDVMPRYYLTDKEVQTIYDYLQTKNKSYLDR